jgi:AraC family transcriptional regulator
MEHLSKALAYIEGHLCERTNLVEIAAEAGVSSFHLTRSFGAMCGLSIMDYVRRRRLSEAALCLRYSNDRIIDVALQYCFESQEAFSRAFKQYLAVTPGQFRSKGGGAHLQHPISPTELEYLKEIVEMKHKIENVEEFIVAGMEISVTMGSRSEIPALWGKFGPRLSEILNRDGNETYGICIPTSDPQDETFSYMVAVRISDALDLPEGIILRRLAAQKYAVFTYKVDDGSFPESLHKYVHQIWSVWLPKSEYVTTGTADFECYDERFDPITGHGEFDIYVPIEDNS